MTPRASCVLNMLRLPASWGLLVFAGSLGVLLGGFMIASVLVLALVAAALAGCGTPWLQREVEAADGRRRLGIRRDHREARMADFGAPREELRHLTRLVDTIRLTRPQDVERFELEELLDYYATVSISYARCRGALSSSDRDVLIHALERTPEWRPGHRRGLLERRLELWVACHEQLERLESELTSIADLIQLLLQRTMLAGVADLVVPDELDRRLARIDAEDELDRQLPAA